MSRQDAVANRARLLAAATVAVHREGRAVPMATIADDAGVGVGTLYRHFAGRDALLDELTYTSYERVLENARESDRTAGTGLEAISKFLDAAVRDRNRLVLPLHGGGAVTTERTRALSKEVGAAVAALIARGREDGTIRPDVVPRDVVLFGAMLAQPHPPAPNWPAASRRLKQIYLRGLQP